MTRLAPRRRLLAGASALAVATLLPAGAFAQANWPTKPVRIVVPFAAGGTTDILARAVAQELSKTFGQSFIVEIDRETVDVRVPAAMAAPAAVAGAARASG